VAEESAIGAGGEGGAVIKRAVFRGRWVKEGERGKPFLILLLFPKLLPLTGEEETY